MYGIVRRIYISRELIVIFLRQEHDPSASLRYSTHKVCQFLLLLCCELACYNLLEQLLTKDQSIDGNEL